MQSETRIYSLPRWRVTRWLADCGPGVPDDIRVELIGNLFGNLPVFVGGVINTVAVAIAIVARKPTAPFIAWLVFEIAVCTARLIVLLVARRAALSRAETPTDIYLILGLAWSASVGYGVIVSLASGDFVIATLACLSSAAMVGGIFFRNFSAPRFAAAIDPDQLGLVGSRRAALGPVAPLCRTAAGAALLHRNDLRGLHAQPDAGRHDAGRARE